MKRKIPKIIVKRFQEEIKRDNWIPLYEIKKEGEDEISIYSERSLIKEIMGYNNGSGQRIMIDNQLSPIDCEETVFKEINSLVTLNNTSLENYKKVEEKKKSLRQLEEILNKILSGKISSENLT